MSEACYWLVYHWPQFTDLVHARQLADDACRYARLAGDDTVLAKALMRRIQVLGSEERLDALNEVTPLLSRLGNYDQLEGAYNNAAWYSLKEGRDHEALALSERAVAALAKGNHPPHAEMISRGTLGEASLFTGDLERAREAFAEVLMLYEIHGFQHVAEATFAMLAGLSAADGASERAALLIGAAEALGYPDADEPPLDQRLEDEFLASARRDLGEVDWEKARRKGKMLSFDDALGCAREAAGIKPAAVQAR